MNLEDLKFFKKNGYLIKKNLINKNTIVNLNNQIKKISKSSKFFESKIVNKKKYFLRLQNPHLRDKLFFNLSRNKNIINIVSSLLGGSVRFHHSKLNFKLPSKLGGIVDWHQDWSFYPHTNDDLLAVGIYLEDCFEENGPLKVIPKSHKNKLYNHHYKGNFVGKITEKLNTQKAVSLIGSAGTVTFHHVRTIHASGLNLTNNSRPLILFGYSAVDAWPLTYDKGSSTDPNNNLKDYDKLIIRGKKTLTPRIEKNPIKMPLPRMSDSIYTLQNKK